MASAKQLAAQRRAERRGFRTVYQMRRFQEQNKGLNLDTSRINARIFQEKDRISRERIESQDRLLARFGVTRAQFRKRDRANREWSAKELQRRSKSVRMQQAFMKSLKAHTYDPGPADARQWSESSVGYVLSFYAANVNRNTNYSSLFQGTYREQKDGNLTERALVDKRGNPYTGGTRRTDAGREAFLKVNAQQYFYLTQFTDLMTVAEYEVSYGSAQAREARAASLRDLA